MTAILLDFPNARCTSCKKKIVARAASGEAHYCSYSCALKAQPQHSSIFMGTYSREE